MSGDILHIDAKSELNIGQRDKLNDSDLYDMRCNNPLQKLIEILSYKAKLNGQEVSKFDERGTTSTCSQCDYFHEDGIPPSTRIFRCANCRFTFPRDHHSCLNFIKRFESALWLRLPDILSGRSWRTELAPFSFKPQRSANHLITAQASKLQDAA